MVDETLIPQIKEAVVGIGLRRVGEKLPLQVHGTGFIVDSQGFIVTAEHVVRHAEQVRDELNNKGDNVELVAILLSHDSEIPKLTISPIKVRKGLIVKIDDLKDYIPQDHDIMICRIYGKWSLPKINLKKPTKLKIYDEIFLCGYPRGDGTLNPRDVKHGMRLSPMIQTGRISSLMPSDNTIRPIGIQTDIVGTGGSSGSPIINANDGEVIGIAQNVFPSTVVDRLLSPIGTSNIGLTWGVTTYFLYDAIYRIIEALKKITDDMGNSTVEKDHVIKMEFKAGEGSFPDLPTSKSNEN